jgi:hypothetical protein
MILMCPCIIDYRAAVAEASSKSSEAAASPAAVLEAEVSTAALVAAALRPMVFTSLAAGENAPHSLDRLDPCLQIRRPPRKSLARAQAVSGLVLHLHLQFCFCILHFRTCHF